MRKDDHLIFEAFQDNLTKTKQALGQNIMRIVKHGMPEEKDVPIIKQELTNIFSAAKKANNKFTQEQEEKAKELIAKLRNSGMPENELRDIYRNAPVDNGNAQNYAKEMEPDYSSQKIGSEAAEDMSKSPFHYDAMKDLAPIANKIYNTLRSAGNDEARPEHIEKMAEIILGPQSAYDSVDHYEKALSGVIELLNHYVNVSMNEGEEMPEKDFIKLKKHINKGPVSIKKPAKELPYTHNYIHDLAKQDSRENYKGEDEERRLDPKCWKGYHKQGTKMKGGKRVNNCVKNEQEEGSYSRVAHEYAERIVGADVDDPKALAKHYLDNPDDVPEPLKHDVLRQNFNTILKYIDFTVNLNQKRKKEEEYKKKELARGPVHPDPEVGLSGSKEARYKPHYKYNPADYLPRQ